MRSPVWFATANASAKSAHSRTSGLFPGTAAQWFPIDLQLVNSGKGYLDVEPAK
jgi:hypothetical protein